MRLIWHLLKNFTFFRSKVTFKTANVTFSFLSKINEIISSKCKKKLAKISWKLWNGKTFPSWLSSFLWTAYHVKTIKYQNDRIVDAVILVHHSFSWNMPHFWEKWQEVRRTLKLDGKSKSRLNSNCNVGPKQSKNGRNIKEYYHFFKTALSKNKSESMRLISGLNKTRN